MHHTEHIFPTYTLFCLGRHPRCVDRASYLDFFLFCMRTHYVRGRVELPPMDEVCLQQSSRG